MKEGTSIRADSPLLRPVNVGLLTVVHQFTGFYFQEIIKMPDWKEFTGRVFAEESASCIMHRRGDSSVQFRFEWNSAEWTLKVTDPDEHKSIDPRCVFDVDIVKGEAMKAFVYPFGEHKKNHVSVIPTLQN